ncbi:hypothetical protein NLG97_g2905 [Lecanicillium saksenae]|uniref:Uncharacterized protein n=1 Tax=Lecanicillium saksenae TaxID=468837 RepID=A0ACC1R289_9HYPO|nr:hypothetical protein NLG97_g2905 [Lecanicillium saksenae]
MRTPLLFLVSAATVLGQPTLMQQPVEVHGNRQTTNASGAVTISGYEHDPYYEAKTKKTLTAFHHNYSKAKFDENGELTNPSLAWYADGILTIGTVDFVNGLKSDTIVFPGLILADVYRILDGDRGAVLYRVQGKQQEEFLGIKPEGRNVDYLQAEGMKFDRNSLLEELQTTSALEVGRKQLLGELPADEPAKDDLDRYVVYNPQTPLAFRNLAKQAATEIHENYNIGQNSKNRDLVACNVTVAIQGYAQNEGPEAFSDLVVHHTKSFSGLLYHDFNIVAEGRLVGVEWAWEGKHDGDYTAPNGTVIPATSRLVRNRGFYFFEFGLYNGLIEKVTAVWNELLVEGQINGAPLLS